MSDDVRENRARRAAARQGLRLQRSRRRDPRALGYGTYRLVNSTTGPVVGAGTAGGFGLTLDQVERHLAGETEVSN